MSKVYDRQSGVFYEEEQFGKDALHFLYHNFAGAVLLKTIVKPWFSKLFSIYYNSALSRHKISPFIKKYDICTEEYEKSSFYSFNDFFTRKKKEKYLCEMPNNSALISPADAKLTVYHVTQDAKINVKGHTYTIGELLKDEVLANCYQNGLCLVFRLGVQDYHRYCHVASGKPISEKKISGCLHTVSSISYRHKVFAENKREYQVIQSDNMGLFVQMEVGALLVGEIINHKSDMARKGEEKGYFSFGGSTIIVLIQEKKVTLDEDILQNASDETEIKVKYSEKIGAII